MSFAQFTSQQGQRTNEAALIAFENKLYPFGLTLIPRSSLSDLNEQNDWQIYDALVMYLSKKASKLYDKDCIRLDIGHMLYTFMTNVFWLSAITLAKLYRERWIVETFFKFIK